MKLLAFALALLCLTPCPSDAEDRVLPDDREAAAKRSEGLRDPVIKQFALEAGNLDEEFRHLWVDIATTRRLLRDYGVAPLASKLQSYSERLTELLRERGKLEERMVQLRLDEHLYWRDHDFIESNYISFSREELRSLTNRLGEETGTDQDGRAKAIQAVRESAAYCRSAIEDLKHRLERPSAEPQSPKDMLDISSEFSGFSRNVYFVDKFVQALDLSYADVFPDRDELIRAERPLVAAWQTELKRTTASGQDMGLLALDIFQDWRRPKLLAEKATWSAHEGLTNGGIAEEKKGGGRSREVATGKRGKMIAAESEGGFASLNNMTAVTIGICCVSAAGTLYLLSRMYAEIALRRAKWDVLKRSSREGEF